MSVPFSIFFFDLGLPGLNLNPSFVLLSVHMGAIQPLVRAHPGTTPISPQFHQIHPHFTPNFTPICDISLHVPIIFPLFFTAHRLFSSRQSQNNIVVGRKPNGAWSSWWNAGNCNATVFLNPAMRTCDRLVDSVMFFGHCFLCVCVCVFLLRVTGISLSLSLHSLTLSTSNVATWAYTSNGQTANGVSVNFTYANSQCGACSLSFSLSFALLCLSLYVLSAFSFSSCCRFSGGAGELVSYLLTFQGPADNSSANADVLSSLSRSLSRCSVASSLFVSVSR